MKDILNRFGNFRADSVTLYQYDFVLHSAAFVLSCSQAFEVLDFSAILPDWVCRLAKTGMNMHQESEARGVRLALSERFRGLFWTQLLGAFNDNFFKQALLILIVFKGLGHVKMEEGELSELASAVFTIPFFLLSATAGQLADKYDKATVIQRLKILEIIIGLIATVGFLFESIPVLFVALGLLGIHSAFFGPLKYGIIPQLLNEEDLVEGNAAVETGTKLAILVGVLSGGFLADSSSGRYLCSLGVVAVALAGYWTSRFIPTLPPSDPHVKVEWNPVTPTFRVIEMARKTRAVFLSILGVSWFWLLGLGLLTLLPVYAKSVLHVDQGAATSFNGMFSIGVAIGAVICGRLSLQRLELGLVPFGSIGISLFLGDLAIMGSPFQVPEGHLLTLQQMLAQPAGWRVALDLIGLAVCSGLYIVPLYTMIQQRTEEAYRSRVIAANNVINAGVMSVGIVLLTFLGSRGLGVLGKFGLLAGLNFLVGLYIYTIIPEFFLRFLAYILNHILYRLRVSGEESIPKEGPALLVGNHASYIDWLVVLGGVHRPVRFVMWHTYYNLPLVKYLFRDAGAIPIGSGKTHPELLTEAFDAIDQSLADGCLVCIFPEGQLSPDGEVGEFRNGIERILERRSVPVIPFALQGLWDSLFSRQPQRTLWSKVKRFFRPRVALVIGSRTPAPPPSSLQGLAKDMRSQVLALRGEKP